MTKRRYNFGDGYVLKQIRLGYVTYVIHPEAQAVVIHVHGCRPLLAMKETE